MDSNTVFIVNEYRARQAKARKEHAAAIEHFRLAAEAASQGDDTWGFCRMTFNTGELQLELGLVDECIATCNRLLAAEAIKEYPDYETRVRVLMTRALHDKGEMGGALAVARDASSRAVEDLSWENRLNVQHALVAALAEEGDTEAAWTEALLLADLLPADASPKERGMAYWAVGNAAFMSDRIAKGLEYHRMAAGALTSHKDVSVWALFNKASASVRLTAGLIEQETVECIERAELAFDVAGVTEMDRVEIVLTRAWWELETGNATVAEGLLRSVEGETAGHFPFLHARALLILARCLHTLGRKPEALERAQQSEGIFNEVGADVFASEARELIDTIEETVS